MESIQDLLVKQEAAETVKEEAEDEEEVPVALARDDRCRGHRGPRSCRCRRPSSCARCFLVKHRSQLADKKKMLCRDCA